MQAGGLITPARRHSTGVVRNLGKIEVLSSNLSGGFDRHCLSCGSGSSYPTHLGGLSEWLKERHWKCRKGVTPSRVRISSPPLPWLVATCQNPVGRLTTGNHLGSRPHGTPNERFTLELGKLYYTVTFTIPLYERGRAKHARGDSGPNIVTLNTLCRGDCPLRRGNFSFRYSDAEFYLYECLLLN